MNATYLSEDIINSKRRQLILNKAREIYGEIPPRPDHLYVKTISEVDFNSDGAILRRYELECEYGGEFLSFPFISLTHTGGEKRPALIHINYASDILSISTVYESVLNLGFNIFEFGCDDVSELHGEIRSGVCRALLGKRRGHRSAGKLAAYAWAASRILDFVAALPEISTERLSIAARGCLAEAALLAGALDQRFSDTALASLDTEAEVNDLFSIKYKNIRPPRERLTDLLPLLKGRGLHMRYLTEDAPTDFINKATLRCGANLYSTRLNGFLQDDLFCLAASIKETYKP